ncbi:unnamed protein product [Cercopithifilaria johnstoni]|uniref:Uncharacterized protein n=1 Tax=Cercopithifilaria johnstoni TaxID=2874296 RepID=A0A8J2Q3L2_9BILA|nr:unnamed protein product [Cercopithifilaria johnstoni]
MEVFMLGIHVVCDMCSSGFRLIINRIGYFGERKEGFDTPCEVWRVEAFEKEGRKGPEGRRIGFSKARKATACDEGRHENCSMTLMNCSQRVCMHVCTHGVMHRRSYREHMHTAFA